MWKSRNESWVLDDVSREGDVAISDWFTQAECWHEILMWEKSQGSSDHLIKGDRRISHQNTQVG